MTTPVGNANLTTPANTQPRRSAQRSADHEAAAAAAPSSPEVSSSRRGEVPEASQRIQTSEAANAAVQRVKHLIGQNPAAALASYSGLDRDGVFGALHTVA